MAAITRSTRWRIVVTGASFVASLGLSELALRSCGDGYRGGDARAETEQLIQHVLGDDLASTEDLRAAGNSQARVLNPYYGYDAAQGQILMEGYIQLHRRADREDFFTVLICGGSVAETFIGMRKGAADYLAELLQNDPRIKGRKVKVMRFARAGYKQPQQLMKLAFFLSQGCVPDAVVNIDGLNELRGGARNLTFGVPPYLPPASHWLHLSRAMETDSPRVEAMLTSQEARAHFIQLASRALEGGWFRSAIAGRLIQRQLKQRFEAWVASQEVYEQRLAADNKLLVASDEDRMSAARECAASWAESSVLMHDICRARGIRYVHLLQPSLHDVDSKPISEREWELGVGEKGLDPFIDQCYDLLRAEGQRLVERSVPFVDTSTIFAEVEETLYFDRAHFGREGNRMYAERIASELLSRY